MLTLLLGTDWVTNRAEILRLIARDVSENRGGRILMVPELISHDTERRLCEAAGDTTSRFAEVLSFTRLARRVADSVGHAAQQCLDNGGRVVAMASAARQMHSKLKAYASVETRPEFLTGLVDAVDEFKRCCITAKDLMAASSRTEGSFAQKLEELSLLFESYDSLCQRGKRDPRDQMSWLLEELENSSFAREHVFYIEGFPDFTRQHMAILEHLIKESGNITISLNCDRPGSTRMAFEKAGDTASELIRCAHRWGVEVEIRNVGPRNDCLAVVREKIFQGRINQQLNGSSLQLYRTETLYQECLATAEKIMELVRSGVRYRDISVVCGDLPAYSNTIEMIFRRCHIPLYLSGTEDILSKSVITTVIAAMDAALGGFEQQDVLRYLKSTLSPLSRHICDMLENYVILWGISGRRWLSEWENNPGGLEEKRTEKTEGLLQELNQARKLAMEPLEQLRAGFQNAANVGQQVHALYTFLEQIKLSKRLDVLARELDAQGDNRNTQILNQLWDILLAAMEQLYDVLGQTSWDTETFTRLFKLLLSQYDVGTIPPVLDAVTVGSVSAMRCQQTKHLFVLGALEGSLPGYGGSAGVLTGQERTALRAMGVPLTGGDLEGLQAEFAEIYGVFCGAEESVTVSCAGGQPSFVYRRLCELAGGETNASYELGAALGDELEAGAYLVRWGAAHEAQKLNLADAYKNIIAQRDHVLGSIDRENIQKIYGTLLNLSASQVDRQAECRLSYFLKYGLRAKERKPASVDPAEFGTYIHAVLEDTCRQVKERGGFPNVTLDEVLKIAMDCSQEYAQERFSQLGTRRMAYLFQRNSQELEMIVKELYGELHGCAFEPIGFEIAFGDDGEMPAILVPGRTMDAQLRGFVDRVDAWRNGDSNFFRVVDYKTGKKDFDYCDIFNGIGLQMLLYLFALEQGGNNLLGDDPTSAGVQYFPARVPLVSADSILSDEEAAAAREKVWKRKGLVLLNDSVLDAMESDDTPNRMPYSRKKDGSLSGDLANTEQFELLKKYVFKLLGNLVDDIASGCVTPNPYTRGSSHNACAFCPYGSICHQETVEDRRNYKTMTAKRFWDEVEKEVRDLG